MTRFSRDPSTWPSKPVIVLTGGNGGVGFGIAQRLLAQLSTSHPTDLRNALKLFEVSADSEFCTPNGLTLVIAARNAVKAHKATASLLRAVGKKPPVGSDHSEWRREKTQQIKRYANFQDLSEGEKQSIMSEDEYRFRWLQNLSIEYVGLDLSSVESVMHCCRELDERYDYITHLMLNAGGGPFIGLHWGATLYRISTRFLYAVTHPDYLAERTGLMTNDKLGWTWQCNVFGHFLMAKLLLDKLYASPLAEPRLIWTGSLDGLPQYYDPEDPQAVDSGCSYQSTKFECALLAWAFNDLLKEREQAQQRVRVRSFVVHPGVVAGNMFRDILGPLLDLGMKLAFYLARWLGSPYHNISAYKAGIAFTFLALAPFALIQEYSAKARRKLVSADPTLADSEWTPTRYAACSDRLGKEYMGIEVVDVAAAGGEHDWFDKGLAEESLRRCDRLADTFLRLVPAKS